MDYRASYTPEEILPKPKKRTNSGYAQITFEGKRVGYHIYIWYIHHGKWPVGVIDHIDGDKENDDISNLRECSYSGNNRNSKIKKSNTSGVKCVYWHKGRQKWAVQLRTDEGRKSFGLHEDLEFAELVANEARAIYHGEFANDGL